MSAESLRSEVRPHLAVHHVIKSADQIYNKDKQVYTQLQTQHAHVPAGVKSKDNHKGGDGGKQHSSGAQNKLQQGIEAAKKAVDDALQGHSTDGVCSSGEVEVLRKDVAELKAANQKLNTEVAEIRKTLQQLLVNSGNVTQNASKEPETTKKANEDDDFDLFGSDDEEDKETDEQKRIREERLAAYAAKKSKKPGPIAKSSVILDVKPWDDETSLEEMEKQVRSIAMDGLLWGGAKQIPIGYGIKKLQIISTVEDEKVSVDDLIDQIQGFEDFVQSVDVVAFNKI